MTTAIRIRPEPEAVASFMPNDGIAVPMEALRDPEIGPELNVSEDIHIDAWLVPLLQEQDVIELGCDVGRRAAYLSKAAKRIVCTDTDHKRRSIAKQTIAINDIPNTVVVDDLEPADLSCGDVLLINSRRPLQRKHIDTIRNQPTGTIVVLGPLSKYLAKDIMGAGYSHQSEFWRGAVFYTEPSRPTCYRRSIS